MINNNDKILHLLAGYRELKPLVAPFLKQLQLRQEQQLLERQSVRQVKQNLRQCQTQLAQQLAPADFKIINSKIERWQKRGFNHYRDYQKLTGAAKKRLLKQIMQASFVHSQPNLVVLVQRLQQLVIPKYPDGTVIIEQIHQIRQRNFYIKRGYQVLVYVKPVYQALTRLRRVLVNQAQYTGCQHAWNNYLQQITALKNYYQQHYVQAGGHPRNYHGHQAGEHQ